jgi:hypothetical protein
MFEQDLSVRERSRVETEEVVEIIREEGAQVCIAISGCARSSRLPRRRSLATVPACAMRWCHSEPTCTGRTQPASAQTPLLAALGCRFCGLRKQKRPNTRSGPGFKLGCPPPFHRAEKGGRWSGVRRFVIILAANLHLLELHTLKENTWGEKRSCTHTTFQVSFNSAPPISQTKL